MGELFAEIGDLVFTLVIGYISAIEFLYVVRHLYHYSCNHDASEGGVDVSQLQDSMSQQLVTAKNKEDLAGTQVMKDGVPYKEGFRLEAQQALIDQLKAQLKDKELSDLRRQELENELEKQKKIAEQLRKELAEAEAKYQRQLKQEEEAKAKKLMEEQKQREQEERAKKEAEEKARQLAEAERQREEEQRKRAQEEKERLKKEADQKEQERIQRKEEQQRKEAQEQARKLAEAEKQRKAEQRKFEEAAEERRRKAEEQEKRERIKREEEEQQRKEAEEQARKLAEAEKQREAEQRKLEEAEEERRRKAEEQEERERIKREEEEQQRKEAKEQARKLAEAEKQRKAEQRNLEEAEEERRRKAEEQEERERIKRKEEQQRKEAEEQARKLAEAEKQREAEQRKLEEAEEERRRKAEEQEERERIKREEEEQQRKEAEEQARKLAEAEKQREIEQRQREEAEENAEKQRENEKRAQQLEEQTKEEQETLKQREIEQVEENIQRLLDIEQAKEQKQAAEEVAADLAAKNRFALEHRLEEQLRAAEREAELTEKERQLIDAIKKRDLNEEEGNAHKEAELLRKILEAREQLGEESEEEQSLRLIQRERDQEAKQKRIEENALLFMEAEKEMAEMQSKLLDAVEKRVFSVSLDSAPQTPIVEEPCIKRSFSPLKGGESSSHSTVKTQLAQAMDEPYSVRTKPLLFPEISDDASSIDPASSKQSSFSTQPSEDITMVPDSQYPAQQRQEPDGEDNNLTHLQYSDDYLRSLDGIKQRPLMREDGSGRRRAFKKRRSSNSSNSSRESRHSRDEELKMFTSLEEEEMKDTADSEFTPIRYTNEPTLKVKGHHHRRHKRSPAKDMRRGDDSLRSSLECLGEETTSDPWGEVKPEHYKHTEFWKREKNQSIDEEMEFERPASSEEVVYHTATNMPSASSFEEATQKQNQEALSALQRHSAKKDKQEQTTADPAAAKEQSTRSDNTNLQISQAAEREASSAQVSASPRLRRSPHIEETDQSGEETRDLSDKSTFTTAQNTPTINVQAPLDYGPWRDEYGLLMQGLSDFYDFTASVNPSRSRSASRNVSPANTAPNTPSPKDVAFQVKLANEKAKETTTVDIYDDTGALQNNELKRENIIKFIDSFQGNANNTEVEEGNNDNLQREEVAVKSQLQYVADDASKSSAYQASLVPLVNIIDDEEVHDSASFEASASSTDSNINSLVSGLRSQQSRRSHSRSKSPLPTADNLKRSVENRRYKLIKHNEDILEKLIESKLLPELESPEEVEEQRDIEKITTTKGNVETDNDNNSLGQTLQIDTRRSRSKSPMRLPTPENLSKGLEKRRTKLIERNDELIKQLEERSLTPESPTIVVEHVYEFAAFAGSQQNEALPLSPTEEEEDCSREQIDLLVQSLRAARSRTSSKSPMRVEEIENINETAESKTFYGFEHSEMLETTQQHLEAASNVPTISIVFSEDEPNLGASPNLDDEDDCSREKMDSLIQSLRVARSRSASRNRIEARAKSPEPEVERSRHSRSKSPSRSHSQSPAANAAYRSNTATRSLTSPSEEYNENLEASNIKTLSINSEEQESVQLINRQRQLDEQALENAAQEMELRTLSPLIIDSDKDELNEQLSHDYLAELPLTERTKLLRKSPTTPDYDRTISEEMRDIERIKQEMLEKGFKRSTYVGESMDLGSEFEHLRKETAKFQRSRSPSPTFSAIENALAQKNAEEKRKIQELILQELTTSTSKSSTDSKEAKNTGAIPKAERFSSSIEVELSLNDEIEDTKRIREEILNNSFQRSTYVEHSEEETEYFEELRERNKELTRSDNKSVSPLHKAQLKELASFEVEQAKEKALEEVSCSAKNFQDFSRRLNAQFFDNERRASDSALMQLADITKTSDLDLEPEEYHHYRRFSLALEQPEEQYPGDDYIFVQKVEVRTRSGSRTWLREDFYSENVDEYLSRREHSVEKSVEADNNEAAKGDDDDEAADEDVGNDYQAGIPAADDEEEYSNASDDDRQTVVEVDDEIDEDISDFNERGPAEESHHETSECEEAEREMDRYAGREASDWNRIADNRDNEDEGAVGGLSTSPYDSDSFAIDQIYDEAIKNRKQSGILREYDSILMQMSVNSDIDEQYLLWSKTNGKRIPKNIEFQTNFLDNERKDSDLRYLGDATITARQSTRLRSRYGYSPVLQAKCLDDNDLQVDLNYKPKREYNWRKNFKLDDDSVKEDKEITLEEICKREEHDVNIDAHEVELQWIEMSGKEEEKKEQMMTELRKFSLGGESVTLFSRCPEKSISLPEPPLEAQAQDLNKETLAKAEVKEEKLEKPKKKKTKKKSHKESKAILEETMNREDEDAYDNQVYSRRSSSLQMETDSPKRKSRSRRNSKSSITNEDSLGVFSPRSSVAYTEPPIADIMEEFTDVVQETTRCKKMKKRKKVKETMANVAENPIENREEFNYNTDIAAVSTVITPASSSANILSTLSPQHSVCVTPASIDEELREDLNETISTNQSSSTTDSSPSGNLSRTSSLASSAVDSFDILKDASFYPLF